MTGGTTGTVGVTGGVVRAAEIRERIRAGVAPDPGLVAQVVGADAVRLGSDGVVRAEAELAAEILGLGPLEPLVADLEVTDVLVNGDGVVWVDRGDGLARSQERLAGPDAVRRLAVRLAGQAGRRLDESQPWVDGLLPGGVRLHAVLPPIADGGAHISLRLARRANARLDDLRATGMFDLVTHQVLVGLVRERCSFVVSGGTGSGKTTLLGALLAEVPSHERIVLVEDVRELGADHPHVVRLQARGRNVEGRGEVTLADLVRQALRMRPDRLVVGEVRGGEVRDLLAALNTGHEGGAGTVHANRAEDVPVRFEALAALAGLDREALHAQLGSALQVVVHLRRDGGRRVIDSVSVLRRVGVVVVAQSALRRVGGVMHAGPCADELERLIGSAPWGQAHSSGVGPESCERSMADADVAMGRAS